MMNHHWSLFLYIKLIFIYLLQMEIIYGVQKWSIITEDWIDCNEDCYITLEYDSSCLTLETTFHQLSTSSAVIFIRLYSTDNDTFCQWLEIYREETICIQSVSNICPHSTTGNVLQNVNISSVFGKIFSGYYCLAVYSDQLSSAPVYNSENPFYLVTDQKELDVRFWTPDLQIQQHNFDGVIIELGLNETDGFLFDEFSLDLFRSDTDFNCKEAEPKVAFHFEVRSDEIISQTVIVTNLTNGFYCFRITPNDPRCVFSHTKFLSNCTRFSQTIPLITDAEQEEESYYLWIIVVAICLSAFICGGILAKIIQKRQSTIQQVIVSQEGSILLLYPDQDNYLQLYINKLKQTLENELPCYQLEDYTDEKHWDQVAEEGVGWFLSRLLRSNQFIIVVETEENDENESQFSFYRFGLQQLQTLASMPDYKRVLTVRFDKIEAIAGPFNHFYLPADADLLISRMRDIPFM